MKLLVLTSVLLFAGAAEAAQPARTAEAVLAAAPEQSMQTVIDGRLWRCLGTGCRAQAVASPVSQSVARECRRVAAELGELAHYRSGKRSLDAGELAACNAVLAKRPADAALAGAAR